MPFFCDSEETLKRAGLFFFFFSGMSHIEDMTDVSSGDTGCVDSHTLLGRTQILLLLAEPPFSVSVCLLCGEQTENDNYL